MKTLILTLFLMIFMTGIATALDCNSLANKDLCNQIKLSNITNSEKDYLIQSIITDSQNFPNFDFVKNWNLGIDTSNLNVQKYNQGYIKNAYVKTLAIMPSIIENNTLYCSDSGQILSAFNHEVQVPNAIMGNDCRTDYNLVQNTGVLNVYKNNNYIGSGKLVNFNTNQDSNFKSEYSITARTDIQHYQNVRYCCATRRGRCVQYCNRCQFSYTEHRIDTLTLYDNLSVKYYNPQTTFNFSVIDKYQDITKINFTANNFSSYNFNFFTSYFMQYNYVYSVVWNEYNILTIKADKSKRIEQNNLFYQGNALSIKNAINCKIDLFTHFKNQTIPCNLNFNDLNITINTDKLVYNPNETIHVTITPSNKIFNIIYANQSYQIQGTKDIQAVYPYNKISLDYQGKIYEKIIHVNDETSFNLLFSLLIFGSVNYSIIGLIKKYLGGAINV